MPWWRVAGLFLLALLWLPPPATGDPVTVRAWPHGDFLRIAFDWGKPVDYGATLEGHVLTVRFDRAGQGSLAPVTRHLAAHVTGVAWTAGDRAVRIVLKRRHRLRHFILGTGVVVTDLWPDPAAIPAVVPAVVAKPVRRQPEAAPAGPPALPRRLAAIPGARPESRPPAKPGATAAPESPRAVKPTAPVPLTDDAKNRQAAAAAMVTFEPTPGGGALRFAGGATGKGVVFVRGGRVWALLDRNMRVDPAGLATVAGDVLTGLERLPLPGATLLRFRVGPGVHPVTLTHKGDWLVDLAQRPAHPLTVLDRSVTGNAGQRRLLLRLGAGFAGRSFTVRDSEAGDAMLLVPIGAAGHGIGRLQRLVDLDILPSAQGLVLLPHRDGLAVAPAAGGIAVDAVAGPPLSLSPPVAAAAGDHAGLSAANDADRLFDLAAWSRPDLGDFSRARRSMQDAVLQADASQRPARRLDLARFYFARGFAARAAGVLAAAVRAAPRLEKDPDFLALRGATRVLLGDHAAAETDLGHPLVRDLPEAALWRAAGLAERGDTASAAVALARGMKQVAAYPPTLRRRFAILGAEVALKLDQPGTAREWLALPDPPPRGAPPDHRLAWLGARADWLDGQQDVALAAFDRLSQAEDRYARAHGLRAATDIRLDAGDIEPDDAIDAYESLQFVWREPGFEFDLLRRLGNLRIETGAYMDGLRAMRQAVTHVPDHPQSGAVVADMEALFRELFLHGRADSLPPVTAIALYNAFRELTPAGAEGDRMIRRLADRLAAVDLLRQASDLLRHQLDFRVTAPAARARLGTRLAELHLLDRDPEGALRVLSETRDTGLPPPDHAARRLIEARAMADLGDGAAAVRLLAAAPGPRERRLQADILWEMQDWAAAADALATLTTPDAILSDRAARDVLRQAIALTLAGNETALARLRDRFGPAMERSIHALDFRVVATGTGTPADLEAAIARIDAAPDYRSFIEPGQS